MYRIFSIPQFMHNKVDSIAVTNADINMNAQIKKDNVWGILRVMATTTHTIEHSAFSSEHIQILTHLIFTKGP